MRALVSLLMIAMLPISLAGAEDRFANVEIQTIPVAENIYMLVGQGGNIGVFAGKDGILMIDDQFAPLSEKIKAALEQIGSDSPRFLLNTHYHGDHTGGNKIFGADSLIVAHENVRVRLLASETPGEYPPVALPVFTYADEANIWINGEQIRVVHMPLGHTDGDSVVFFEQSNVVHMGDHFFKDRFPFVDLDAGGSVQGLIDNVNLILDLIDDNTAVIPGHGSLADKEDLQRYLAMLEQTSSMVRKAIEAGKSEEEILAAGMDDRWESWGTGFINEQRWTQTLYNSFVGDM
ncbi:MAG: MBL fold metallo-hydrolase [Pseudomonadales bacterium]|nr:MBL fold metallo-hydrolase [Pseudomonadales bacterium]